MGLRLLDPDEIAAARKRWEESREGYLARCGIGPMRSSIPVPPGQTERRTSVTVEWASGERPPAVLGLIYELLLRLSIPAAAFPDDLRPVAPLTRRSLEIFWLSLLKEVESRVVSAVAGERPKLDGAAIALAAALRSAEASLPPSTPFTCILQTDPWPALRRPERWTRYGAGVAAIAEDVALAARDGDDPTVLDAVRTVLSTSCPVLEVAESGRPYVTVNGDDLHYHLSRRDRATVKNRVTTNHAALRYLIKLMRGKRPIWPGDTAVSQLRDALRTHGLVLDWTKAGDNRAPRLAIGARLEAMVPALLKRR